MLRHLTYLATLTVTTMALNTSAAADLTVRVSVTNGAPRLLVNGKPVRARMFFGGPGSNPIRVGPEGRLVEFSFTAGATAPGDGTMHFRFGHVPGDVYLDDIRVTDAAGGDVIPVRGFEEGPGAFAADWTTWPPADRNTVGKADVEAGAGRNGTAGLHVSLKAPPNGDWPDYHVYHLPNLQIVEGHTYRVSFWSRAVPARDLTVAFYRPGQTFVYLGGPPGRYESQIRLAAGAGVDFVSYVSPTPWPKPGEQADWTAVDAEAERILKANPHALLLPRFSLDPPGWWAEAHPTEMMQWENGSRQYTAVPASPVYRRDAAAQTEALVRHLEARYGDHMAGYHPCGQNTGEWFYQSTWESLLNGYAPADLAGWREWLRTRYATDAALRAAWHDPAAALDQAAVPTAAERRATPNGTLRDPASERKLVDWADYQQTAMADLVRALAHGARTGSAGKKLVVFFYGYAFEFGPVALGPATSGHYAMRRVLDCPDIDIVCSPISYGDRGLDGSGPVMSAAESVALTGSKMWLQEDDTRTHESPEGPDAIARLSNLAETNNVLARNVANEATRNLATWWMDLGMAGWFDDPGIWELMRKLAPLDAPFVERAIPFRPQVAAVMDERSMLLVGPGAAASVGLPDVYEARQKLARMGAPFGQFLADDVAAGRVKARLYVFLNTWWVSPERRQALLRATKGAARVWCYAPGAFGSEGPDEEGMRALTGFQLARVGPAIAWAEPTAAGKRLGLTAGFGLKAAVKPLFAATDATPTETLATYPDGSAAVAMRRTPEGVSLFVGAPGLTPELLRIAARASGVHLYTQTNCCVFANGPFVCVHAVADGPVSVDTGRAGTVTDVLTGKPAGKGPTLRLTLKKGDTRILRVQP